jgi:hypothetical protein
MTLIDRLWGVAAALCVALRAPSSNGVTESPARICRFRV